MTLEEYKTLSGISVPTSKEDFYNAQILRVQNMLETMLGYSLDPTKVTENFYNELGKSRDECACPNVDTEVNLDPKDSVVGAYRLYSFNNLDQYLHVDPFKKVHKVKLIYVRQGEEPNGVTIRTFEMNQIRLDIGRDGIGKYLELCRDCMCSCNCDGCVQLAVDADWGIFDDEDKLPLELQYVIADMVTYYANPRKDIKSESITTHSYTRFNVRAPETEPVNMGIIKKYAGPYGSSVTMPTTGAPGRRYV